MMGSCQPIPQLRPVVLAVFDGLLPELTEACHEVYRDRLVSLAVFGSLGRRVPRPDSDIDLLVVADPLPAGRLRRVAEFEAVDARLAPALSACQRQGIATRPSPVFKTPAEVERGSPLFLDLVDDARILLDRDGFLAGYLEKLRGRLRALGARRVWRGDAWYWDLKPDYRPGEVFEL